MVYDPSITDRILSKVAEGEPVFVVRAQDKFAPAIIRQWILEATARGVNSNKLLEAQELQRAIMQWQSENPDKVKDPD